MTRALLVLLAVMAALLAGCGDDDESSSSGGGTGSSSSSSEQPGEGKPAVTIGTKDFTEEFVLGNLYAQALEAKGYQVNLKENIGSTEIIDKALTSGEIDGYPEYTGVSLSVVGRGSVVLDGEPRFVGDDTGVYSFEEGVDCGFEPERCTPLPELPVRFQLEPPENGGGSLRLSPR